MRAGVAVERWRRTARSAGRAWDERRVADAIRLYGKAAQEAEQAGETVMLGVILHNLGLALDQDGDGERARDVLLRARDLLSPAGAGEAGERAEAAEAAEYLAAVLRASRSSSGSWRRGSPATRKRSGTRRPAATWTARPARRSIWASRSRMPGGSVKPATSSRRRSSRPGSAAWTRSRRTR
jgi:hypothetical protein